MNENERYCYDCRRVVVRGEPKTHGDDCRSVVFPHFMLRCPACTGGEKCGFCRETRKMKVPPGCPAHDLGSVSWDYRWKCRDCEVTVGVWALSVRAGRSSAPPNLYQQVLKGRVYHVVFKLPEHCDRCREVIRDGGTIETLRMHIELESRREDPELAVAAAPFEEMLTSIEKHIGALPSPALQSAARSLEAVLYAMKVLQASTERPRLHLDADIRLRQVILLDAQALRDRLVEFLGEDAKPVTTGYSDLVGTIGTPVGAMGFDMQGLHWVTLPDKKPLEMHQLLKHLTHTDVH